MATNKRDSTSTGLIQKLTSAGKTALKAGAVAGALLMSYSATSNKANADIIQVANQVERPYTSTYASALNANLSNVGTSFGYDAGIDHLLDTSTNPNPFAGVIYSSLDGNAVGLNIAPEPTLTDTSTMLLSFENKAGVNNYNLPNSLILTDFSVDNPNGITDWSYALSVDTDSNGTYDYTKSGLVSEVFASADKKFGEWTQDLPTGIDWREEQSYGQITFTPVGVPEPSGIALLTVASLVAGAGYVASHFGKGKKKQT